MQPIVDPVQSVVLDPVAQDPVQPENDESWILRLATQEHGVIKKFAKKFVKDCRVKVLSDARNLYAWLTSLLYLMDEVYSSEYHIYGQKGRICAEAVICTSNVPDGKVPLICEKLREAALEFDFPEPGPEPWRSRAARMNAPSSIRHFWGDVPAKHILLQLSTPEAVLRGVPLLPKLRQRRGVSAQRFLWRFDRLKRAIEDVSSLLPSDRILASYINGARDDLRHLLMEHLEVNNITTFDSLLYSKWR